MQWCDEIISFFFLKNYQISKAGWAGNPGLKKLSLSLMLLSPRRSELQLSVNGTLLRSLNSYFFDKI